MTDDVTIYPGSPFKEICYTGFFGKNQDVAFSSCCDYFNPVTSLSAYVDGGGRLRGLSVKLSSQNINLYGSSQDCAEQVFRFDNDERVVSIRVWTTDIQIADFSGMAVTGLKIVTDGRVFQVGSTSGDSWKDLNIESGTVFREQESGMPFLPAHVRGLGNLKYKYWNMFPGQFYSPTITISGSKLLGFVVTQVDSGDGRKILVGLQALVDSGVESVVVDNFKYSILKQSLPGMLTIDKVKMVNGSTAEQTSTETRRYTSQSTNKWEAHAGLKLGMEVTLQTGVPLIAKEGMTLTAEVSMDYTWGKEWTYTEEDEKVFSCVVPANKTITASVQQQSYVLDANFTADLTTTRFTQTVFKDKINGNFCGAGGSEITVEYVET